MAFEDIQEIIAKDEHRCLELKKTTGELQDGMHSACAFLNTDGGWLIFGVAPKSLKILGQQVTDSTQREIAQALAGLYPAVEVKPENTLMCREGMATRLSLCTSMAGGGDRCLTRTVVALITRMRALRR